MFKTLKQFFDFCNKEDRNKLYLAIALGVIKAVFAALRMPAIAVVVQGLIDGQMTMKHLWLSLGIMVVSVLGQFLINLKTTMLQCEAGYHSCAHKRIEIAEHLRYLPMGFFNQNSLGAITNVTTNTMESLADIATRIVMITTQGILTTAVITCFVFAFDWRIGLVLAAGIVLYIIFNAVMQQATRPAAPRKHRADEEMVSQVIEYVQGIAEVKNYSMTDDTAKKLDAAIIEKQGADTHLEYTVIPWVTMQNLATKMTGVVMCILSLKLYFSDSMPLLYCIMMMVASFMVYESLDSMSSFTALMRNIHIAVTKTKEILDMPPMDIDGAEIEPFKRDIELKKVSFSYDKKKIIDGVSLRIPEKTTTAFVGPSGGGKTTLCHLMARFWDVQEGEVFLGGKNVKDYVKIRKARKSGSRGDGKCPSCNFGTFKTFYLGYDAATAVLGTALFEELPESEKVLKSKKSAQPVKKSLFGVAKQGAQVDIVRRKRQFLSFSDSRGEAAFFASYMTASYSEFLRRRGIWHVVEKNKENMAAHPWEIQHFVDELTSYFDSCRTFAEPGDKGVENLTATSRKNAWIAVLNEMVNARRSTSLASLGILKFNYKGNAEEIMSGVAEAYQQKVEDVKALFDLLAMEIVYHGALEGDCDLTDDEREYIFYTPKPKRVKRCKDMDKDKKKSYLAGWSAAIRKNGSLLKNGRLKRVMSVLNLDEASANELLQMYWDEVLRGEESLSTAGNDEFYFSTERFTVSSGTEDIPIYVCDVCGKTTMMNCKDMCTTIKCGGHLRKITHESLLKDNHYAKLYQSTLMQPLHIKEHTAQLGREEQQKYQEMFVNKEINALSCSTTFEMGVDVGDLETVYLRNMPPSPANYVQRAGRAGRGKNAAAFSLTYSKLSSHDFTYFKNPENMITGKIGVPLFTVRNEKVILRHIFAVALSDFFAKQVDVYNSNNADVLLNGDGWERFCAYLSSKPEHLKDILKASIPESMHEVMGINDFSWIKKLVGEDGVMKVAVDEFRGTVQYYIDEYQRLLAEGLTQQAAAVEKKLWSYRRGKEDNRGRNELIEFLVRNNVLPKYGFPVDTVELYQNTNTATDKKLQMVRDLQLAISEYAPDSQVVADGKLYTSRYIRKLPQTTGQDWETAYIAQCNNPSCMTWNHRSMEPDEGGEPCVSCHEIISRSRWKQAIEPRKGFVADAKPKDVPMRKPDKAFRSDDFYIGDAQRQVMQKYAFVMKDGNRFQMETSINDSLMVVCNDDFFVCPHCGYAESTTENMEVAGFNSHQKTLEKKHITPWGKACEVKLVKNKLCHVFRTDVVRLVFSTPQAGNQEVMLSVMYALLEALSSVLDIERNDIKGCLHKVVYDNRLIYSIVLYDAVAGGAGHVRRLVTEDGTQFCKVVEKAIAITKGCNCSPSCYSCLRNYYNQKIHDLLNRRYAYEFLENYAGELEPITNEEFESRKII